MCRCIMADRLTSYINLLIKTREDLICLLLLCLPSVSEIAFEQMEHSSQTYYRSTVIVRIMVDLLEPDEVTQNPGGEKRGVFCDAFLRNSSTETFRLENHCTKQFVSC